MKKQFLALGILLLCQPGLAAAASTVLAGSFNGTEAKAAPFYGVCDVQDLLAYQDAGTLRVSASGTYSVLDVLYLEGAKYNGVDLTILVYDGPFDAANPSVNLVRPNADESGLPFAVDTAGSYDLDSGQSYRLILQQACTNKEGAWAVSFTGPGSIESDLAVTSPPFTGGAITSSSPVSPSACGFGGYRESGPFRFERSGTYYYQDISVYSGDIDVCLQVYTAPFDPVEPNVNRVPTSGVRGFFLDNSGTVELEAGRDYWFVVQPRNSEATGSYYFVLAPPASFRINRGLAGAWFNSETAGQGVFMDIYDDTNQLFAGWYTFDLQRPVDGTAALGEPGHRWLTALGPIDGARAELDVFLARGGAFDAADPPVETPQTRVGTMTVEFENCVSGTIAYDLTVPAVSGVIPVQPLTLQHVESCELMSRGPGMPGPL
ncbi:MAG: hypothetical protein PVI83_01665 [Lysobacterales bacterium]|jgi:hypothetical protein